MSGFPFTIVDKNFSFLPPYYSLDANGQPVVAQNVYAIQTGGFANFSPTGDGLTSPFTDYDDPHRTAGGSSRTRRRNGMPGDSGKFRRTRTGCFTCRTRRVKCDESRPTCERCRKGNRTCSYPEPAPSNKGRRGSTKDDLSHDDASDAGSDELRDHEEDVPLSAISGPSESPFDEKPQFERSDTTESRDSPFSATGSSDAFPRRGSVADKPQSLSDKMAVLPADIRELLEFTRQNLTNYHFNQPLEGPEFVENTIVENSLKYEPLRYAVVCFAAFHRTLSRPDGHVKHFMGFYNQSLKLLAEDLKKNQKHNYLILLTILTLANIEECLGDWVNLMIHQKAAYQIIVELYTPETIMNHPVTRSTIKWYLYFDSFVGMLAGTESLMSRRWLEAISEFHADEYDRSQGSIRNLYEHCSSLTKLLSFDTFHFFNQLASGQVPDEELEKRSQYLLGELGKWEDHFPVELAKEENLVTNVPEAPYDPNDESTAPYKPLYFWGGENFPTNTFRFALFGLRHMLEGRLSTWKGQPKPEQMSKEFSKMIFGMVNSVRYWPETPPGAFLNFRAVFSLAVFLNPPTEEREISWARSTFAALESEGYLFPSSLRAKLEAQWMVDLSSWWLPNNEGAPPLLLSIREFTSDRTTALLDNKSTDLRDMRGIFNTLSLSDSSSPESVQSPSSSSNTRGASEKRSPADDLHTPIDSPDLSSWNKTEFQR